MAKIFGRGSYQGFLGSALGFQARFLGLLLLFCAYVSAKPCTEERTMTCKDLCPKGYFDKCFFDAPNRVSCACFMAPASKDPRTVAANPCTKAKSDENGNFCDQTLYYAAGQFTRVYNCDGPSDKLCLLFGQQPPPVAPTTSTTTEEPTTSTTTTTEEPTTSTTTTTEEPTTTSTTTTTEEPTTEDTSVDGSGSNGDFLDIIIDLGKYIVVIVKTVVRTIKFIIVTVLKTVKGLFRSVVDTLSDLANALSL